MNYEPIIGLEVHVELATKSKMFCGCPADHFGRQPNTVTCPVCLGLPGALPVPNKKAIEWAILLGLALRCTVQEKSKFDRKNYFYPDLPKGYQISQYDQPLATGGWLELSNNPIIQSSNNPIKKKIRIRRVHLEEDTGKLQHAVVNGTDVSLVDFNRSGVPLVEIVTEPDFSTVEEVDQYVKKIQQIIRYLGISGADMEKGSMRIEPSVSLRELKTQSSKFKTLTQNNKTKKLPQYRVEIKNINSFKFARRAIEYEIERQTEMLQKGVQPLQQTRGFVESKGITVAQREKEEANDYRYFPEPDIPPMKWEQSTIHNLQLTIPELPDTKTERFMRDYQLSEYDATILVETRERAQYFEDAMKQATSDKRQGLTAKTIANWIINKKVDVDNISSAQLIDQIAQSMQTSSMSEGELEKIIKVVLAQNPKAVEDYRKGKEQALMFLIGHVMRETKGKCSAEDAKKLIIDIMNGKNS